MGYIECVSVTPDYPQDGIRPLIALYRSGRVRPAHSQRRVGVNITIRHGAPVDRHVNEL